ncbi:MAG: multicomponent Na+:H+ antiporter subunit [Methanolobus sp.]|jgi:multicomponent Na+:H+ antiporter subunit C|nr:multicomponent Na+:H+ antiporter subunit [Methanolobus sp.]MDK2833923.1 multicomponent Na+:H+ antiporter subunit [Methanolobus sp.]MDK2911929.1 multicomponent Na+:H+ antiporter subunit [Methanolobus sp.]
MNDTLLSVSIALVFGIATFMILRRDLIRVAIGVTLLSHATNMLIVSTGAFLGDRAPIITGEEAVSTGGIFIDDLAAGILAPVIPEGTEMAYVDPLVQALTLTAIVISLATTAFLLILCYRLYQEQGTTDVSEIRRLKG